MLKKRTLIELSGIITKDKNVHLDAILSTFMLFKLKGFCSIINNVEWQIASDFFNFLLSMK